jgi:predicted amidohydrolase
MIRIAAANYPISFHNTWEDWTSHTRSWVASAVAEGAEILLFPEYGAMELVSIFPEHIRRDIHFQVNAIDEWSSRFCDVFQQLAKEYSCVIVAPSLPVKDHQRMVNRAFVFGPSGNAGYQDKFFMTRFEKEEWMISEGEKELTVFSFKGVRFGIQICYDIEFPIGAKYLSEAGAQIILVPSCTETLRGATRVHVGARARALEQQVFTVVAQTTGEALWSPAVDVNYGYTGFYTTPDGDFPETGILQNSEHLLPGWTISDLDVSKIDAVRSNGSVLNYKDQLPLSMTFRDQDIAIKRVEL